MTDPWTERNQTKGGREAAQREIDLKKQKVALIKRGLIRPLPKTDIGYPKPRPFWQPR
jgi:hypothetical protein